MSSLLVWVKHNPQKAGLFAFAICGVMGWLYFNRKNNKNNAKKDIGRLIFVTGRSGAGKTSLGESFKALDNFIHFDGDQYSYGAHPIKDSGKIITTDTYSNRSKELIYAYDTQAHKNGYDALWRDEKPPLSVWTPYYKLLAEEIKKVQSIYNDKNIIITQAAYPFIVRQYLRDILGNQLIFIIINVSTDILIKRVMDRMTKEGAEIGQTLEERVKSFGATMKQFEQQLVICMKGFDLKQNNEPNTYQIDVDANMSSDQVFQTAQILINSHQN
eukprot:143094_1